MVVELLALDIPHVVAEAAQISVRRHLGVQVPEGPGRRVPGVLQRLLGGFVILFQHGQEHDAFALDLHAAREGNGEGEGTDGLELGQDGLARDAVAPGSPLDQQAVLVGQVDGQPVELVFEGVERILAQIQ